MNSHAPKLAVHLRVFISSPGDVAEERQLAREAISELAHEPEFESAKLEAVSWDDPQGPTPLVAQLDPQGAVALGLPRPSECDAVIGILWARMGSPLPRGKYRKTDGSEYLSGTEYELDDALGVENGPDVLLYRRSEEPVWSARDPELPEKQVQLARVDAYLEAMRSAPRYVHPYARAIDLKEIVKNDLRKVLAKRLASGSERSAPSAAAASKAADTAAPTDPVAEAERIWQAKAEGGDVHAMVGLALMIKERKPREAERWFKKAAKLGSVEAMFSLGMSLLDRKPEEAETWLRKAAEAGDVSGMAHLGLMLRFRSPEEAEFWLRKAATAGVEYAMTDLGVFLRDRNPQEAELWLSRAAKANDHRGMYNYGVLLEARNPKEAESWFRRAAAAGNSDARLRVLDLS